MFATLRCAPPAGWFTTSSPTYIVLEPPRITSYNVCYTKLLRTITSGNTWSGVFYNVKKDGSYYWEEATIAPVLQNGAITHFICTKQDITHRKNAVDALKSSEEQFRILAENSPIHILKIDEDGVITYANKGVFEVEVPELLGKTIYSFFDARYHSIACENIAP